MRQPRHLSSSVNSAARSPEKVKLSDPRLTHRGCMCSRNVGTTSSKPTQEKKGMCGMIEFRWVKDRQHELMVLEIRTVSPWFMGTGKGHEGRCREAGHVPECPLSGVCTAVDIWKKPLGCTLTLCAAYCMDVPP